MDIMDIFTLNDPQFDEESHEQFCNRVGFDRDHWQARLKSLVGKILVLTFEEEERPVGPKGQKYWKKVRVRRCKECPVHVIDLLKRGDMLDLVSHTGVGFAAHTERIEYRLSELGLKRIKP